MQGFTNSPEIGEKGANYMGMPLKDMKVFQTSDYYYGSGRVFGVGAQVSEENKARPFGKLVYIFNGCAIPVFP